MVYSDKKENKMFNLNVQNKTKLRQSITANLRVNEKTCVVNLIENSKITKEQNANAIMLATKLISKVRKTRVKGVGVDSLMQQFKLSTNEGIALMCLAESLLRIPDKITQNKLIRDKVSKGSWSNYTKTENLFANAASWGLLITGKLTDNYEKNDLSGLLLKLLAKGGEPLIRMSMATAVRFLGDQFVMGETVDNALSESVDKEKQGYQFSYDMLGEAALTDDDSMRYMQSYIDAIHAVGVANNGRGVINGPGISVKLSAIHPRYQTAQQSRVLGELYPRLKHLYLLAKQYQIAVFIDAEESERLEISLDLLEMLISDKDLAGFTGIGFVIQAYQKRAFYVIDYIASIAHDNNQRIMIRLVKGAYWDSEIKKAQIDGQEDYPVFTRKFYTDLSYIACAEKLLNYQKQIYPLFATHNAYTLALIYQIAQGKEYEFQGLYGMCETLYDHVVGKNNLNITCRIYAPVGSHKTLLAYLVRRLLENGANSSFVHQIVDKKIPIEELVVCPINLSKKVAGESNPYFTKPDNIFPDGRLNSKGLDLTDELFLISLQKSLDELSSKKYTAYPLLANIETSQRTSSHAIVNPANLSDVLGKVIYADLSDVDDAMNNAVAAFHSWSNVEAKKRAEVLLIVADKMEEHYHELLNILVRESGKTLQNAVGEVREAVDFCRYYANQAINEFSNDTYKSLGVLVCISPWNFPLAIFMGEISSALVTGNTVIAKPSEQTNLVAFYAVNLFYEAGMPRNVLQFLPGSGSIIGNALTKHKNIKGVIFTGSTETAQTINKNLSSLGHEYVLIAETGGQNAMIVDSSALPEQVVADVISSGFDSAGQRCSALRVLYLQVDIADTVLEMLKGAMAELRVGSPTNLATDIGPVIDTKARKILIDHIEKMRHHARMFYQAPLRPECANGIFVPPTLIEIGSINELQREVFGPVVHVVRFSASELDNVINEINSSGYGLTQGVHSRIEATAKKIYENIKAGNIYINRNMVGAVVGVQPFGGEGLSGTGPKAGGPLYLHRLVSADAYMKVGDMLRKYDFAKLDSFMDGIEKYGFTTDEKQILSLHADLMRYQSPLTMQVDLPGPTGEQNFMFFANRGNVLCVASNRLEYARQIICALATDNIAVLPRDENSKIFAKLFPDNILVEANAFGHDDLRAVLIANNYKDTADLRKLLANRNGCLIINVPQQPDNSYNLHLLTIERTVSNNVTATGGNVQLMSIDDKVI
jgi:RHH-type transcriptional regulator, proline utilization regulon repressor / proline dehydrogenase / delta 1-pyrroline-5-carboxylate dehydrogenase